MSACVVCLEECDAFVVIDCGHSFCSACVSRLSQCPLCRLAFQRKVPNFLAHDLLAEQKKLKQEQEWLQQQLRAERQRRLQLQMTHCNAMVAQKEKEHLLQLERFEDSMSLCECCHCPARIYPWQRRFHVNYWTVKDQHFVLQRQEEVAEFKPNGGITSWKVLNSNMNRILVDVFDVKIVTVLFRLDSKQVQSVQVDLDACLLEILQRLSISCQKVALPSSRDIGRLIPLKAMACPARCHPGLEFHLSLSCNRETFFNPPPPAVWPSKDILVLPPVSTENPLEKREWILQHLLKLWQREAVPLTLVFDPQTWLSPKQFRERKDEQKNELNKIRICIQASLSLCVKDLCSAIADTILCWPTELALIFKGQKMALLSSLEEHNVQREATLHVIRMGPYW